MTAIYLPATSERELGLHSARAIVEKAAAEAMARLNASKERKVWVGTTKGIRCFLEVLVVEGRPMQFARLENARDSQRHALIPLSDLWTLLIWAGDHGGTLAQERQAMIAARATAERIFGFIAEQNCIDVLDAMHSFAEDFKNAKPVSGITTKEWLAANAEDGVTFTVDDKAVHV